MRNMNESQPSKLCQEFAAILDATPGVINGVCIASRSRTNIRPVVLDRRAESFMFVPQAFSFESIDSRGNALCLGETVILQEELNPFISVLRENNILVTAFHNHWLFENPRLMYIHFETIEKPLEFAKKVRQALKVLTNKTVVGKSGGVMNGCRGGEKLCEMFHKILGGTQTFEDGVCMVMRSRLELEPSILGRPSRSFLAVPQMFAFESLTSDGNALCSGETVLLQEEFNPLVSRLRKLGMIVTAFHNHWLADDPRLMYLHFIKIENPVVFAMDIEEAFEVLED